MGRYLLLAFSILFSSAAIAEQNAAANAVGGNRVALVIGNGSYENIDDQLKNPPNDATALAAKLKALGIQVIEATDLDYRGMREALRKFDRALQGADAGLFFYAGHGMEYRGRNYLFPTDVILETEGDVGLSLIDIDQVLRVMETAVPTRLIFLDACRNNPLMSRFGRTLTGSRTTTINKGLGRIDASVGTFIAYATAPGEIAVDGRGNNSPFTEALLQHLDEPGLELSQLMHKVRNSVIEATNEKQIPWESSSLRGPFVLNHNQATGTSTVAALTPANEDNQRVEKMFWNSIKDDGQPAAYETYLELYGDDGLFASEARARMKANGSEQPEDIENIEAALGFDRHSVQQDLSALGYYDGDANGAFDWQMRLAIQGWQQDHGVEETGFLAADQVSQIEVEASLILSALEAARSEYVDEQRDDLEKPSDADGPAPAQQRPIDQPQISGDLFSDPSAESILDSFAENIVVSELEARAGDGDAAASVIAGLAYSLGRNVDQNYEKARPLLEQGCEEGIPRSCHSLATLYENGLGIDQNYQKARALFDQGCESGIARSCHSLGYLYDEGLGGEQDYSKARDFYRQGCEGGEPHACTDLGFHYDQALGVAQDYAEARGFYQKGCDGGSGSGCANLGYLYDGGLGVDPDFGRARTLYRKGCDLGHARACSNLGNLYDGGLGVDQDYAKAKTYYELACDGEHAAGCDNLAYLYSKGLGVDADATMARALYRKACDLEDVRFCEKLLQ